MTPRGSHRDFDRALRDKKKIGRAAARRAGVGPRPRRALWPRARGHKAAPDGASPRRKTGSWPTPVGAMSRVATVVRLASGEALLIQCEGGDRARFFFTPPPSDALAPAR